MSIKFKAKILSALLIVTGVCGFSAVHAGYGQLDVVSNASKTVGKYTENDILNLVSGDNEDEIWEFLCNVVDSDDVESLVIFFSHLDYGDKNYYFYSPYCSGMTILERAQFQKSEDVYSYLFDVQYGC